MKKLYAIIASIATTLWISTAMATTTIAEGTGTAPMDFTSMIPSKTAMISQISPGILIGMTCCLALTIAYWIRRASAGK